MQKKFLIAAKNTDGRVCCWAQGADLEAVKKSVDERWPTHGGSGDGCYPGEERGANEVHLVDENGSVLPLPCPECLHTDAYPAAGRPCVYNDEAACIAAINVNRS